MGNDENEIVRRCRRDIKMEGYERKHKRLKNKNIILRNELIHRKVLSVLRV